MKNVYRLAGGIVMSAAMTLQLVAGPLPAGFTERDLRALKGNGFAKPAGIDARELALALLDYLGHRDPFLRDDTAFGALQHWMRAKQLEAPTVRELGRRLSAALDDPAPDTEGFRKPFSALVLAEVARCDRIEKTFSDAELAVLVGTAARYLAGITDYRGFDEKDGYRHGVAHAADLLLQLSLNPRLTREQLDAMKSSIATQLTGTKGHAYRHGEPGRLMAPAFYMARRRLHTAAEWSDWLSGLASPRPAVSWTVALTTQEGWARKHNVESFLLQLYASVGETEDGKLRALLLPGLRDALKAMP